MIHRALRMMSVVLVLLLGLFLYFRMFKTTPWVCPRVEHTFLNEKYDIERCAGGGGGLRYNVRLRIYSKSNELLAQRDFATDKALNSSRTDYLSDKIIYNDAIFDYDDGVSVVEAKVLQFPLTERDWFEANLDRILFSP